MLLQRLRFVLAPGRTKAVQHILMRRLRGLGARDPHRRALEVNAEAMAVAEAAALRIERHGGFALFVDYGEDGPYESSLNAIRHHGPVHPLQARLHRPLSKHPSTRLESCSALIPGRPPVIASPPLGFALCSALPPGRGSPAASIRVAMAAASPGAGTTSTPPQLSCHEALPHLFHGPPQTPPAETLPPLHRCTPDVALMLSTCMVVMHGRRTAAVCRETRASGFHWGLRPEAGPGRDRRHVREPGWQIPRREDRRGGVVTAGACVVQEPGSADLTAWVDFGSLRQAVSESLTHVRAHGPITQGNFCLANGMEERLDALLQVRRHLKPATLFPCSHVPPQPRANARLRCVGFQPRARAPSALLTALYVRRVCTYGYGVCWCWFRDAAWVARVDTDGVAAAAVVHVLHACAVLRCSCGACACADRAGWLR